MDIKWEEAHAQREWGRYPKEELVKWVARNYYSVPERSAVKFLDLGAGAGASTRFLKNEGFTVVPVDGSISAIKRIGWGIVADATDLPFEDNSFDVVIDVLCLAHNIRADIDTIVDEIARVLKPGGRVFSVLPDGSNPEAYSNYGAVHFFDRLGADLLFRKHFTNITVDWTLTCEGAKYTKEWFVKAQ